MTAGGIPLHSCARAFPELRAAPAAVFSRLAGRSEALFFDSATSHEDGVGISLVTCEPEAVLTGSLNDPGALRHWLAAHAVDPVPGVGYPAGGAFGHVTYEGEFRFGLYRNALIFSHESREWIEVGRARHWLDGAEASLSKGEPVRLIFRPRQTREWFEAAVTRAQDYIAAGDIYQVNLSQRFEADWPAAAQPWDFYRHLREVSPAPFGAFLSWPGNAIFSSSPEQFLRVSGRQVETRPIKGTRPRFADPERDARAVEELLRSEKERAELVMITDLERNDLGQFCEFGSVEACEVARLERFAQVHHLVSVVRGTMRRDCDAVTAFRLAFPGGSITGAPKRRAMEIIRELEGERRGVYTGALGYFGLNGESQFAIAIRTAELCEGRVELAVGAGIVADSVAGAEYEETLHKAAGMFQAANSGPEWRKGLRRSANSGG